MFGDFFHDCQIMEKRSMAEQLFPFRKTRLWQANSPWSTATWPKQRRLHCIKKYLEFGAFFNMFEPPTNGMSPPSLLHFEKMVDVFQPRSRSVLFLLDQSISDSTALMSMSQRAKTVQKLQETIYSRIAIWICLLMMTFSARWGAIRSPSKPLDTLSPTIFVGKFVPQDEIVSFPLIFFTEPCWIQ